MGEIRRWLRLTFPAHFVVIVAAAVAVAALGILALALLRIREHRPQRYALVAAGTVLAVAYSIWSALGNPESDVVEHVHFIEYGLVGWLFFRAWSPLGDGSVLAAALLSALSVGTSQEWFQWFIPARVGEVRDIFLNGVSIVSGLLVSLAVAPLQAPWKPWSPRSWQQLLTTLAIAIAAFAAFPDSVHLGYENRDADGHTFRSIYATADLGDLAASRAAEWAAQPPLVRPPRISREDQYMSEGLLHVQARNTAWTDGDIGTAWAENRILEEYFGPVLDTPSYVSQTGHRWPPEQRADAEHRGGGRSAAAFVSHAQGTFPIFTWPRALFRALSVVAVAPCLVGAIVCRKRRRLSCEA